MHAWEVDELQAKFERLEEENRKLKERLLKYESKSFNSGKFVVRTRSIEDGDDPHDDVWFLYDQSQIDEVRQMMLEDMREHGGKPQWVIISITPQADPTLCHHHFVYNQGGNDHVDYYICTHCGKDEDR